MIPKIEIRYSRIYDKMFRCDWKKNYPTQRKITGYIEEIKPLWKKHEKRILNSIQENSGLKWREKKIIVYIVGICIPFSDPLTLRVFKNKDRFINVLTHELIHQIQIQSANNWEKWWNYLNKKYKKESEKTKSHIFLNAVNYKVILDIFDNEKLKEEMKYYDRLKDYKIAWEIVKKETPDIIIKKFRSLIK